ncbi:MAG: glycosyltransferase family 39 protein [Deltaproteobacteria bacterium]|nr:glycosyltransferase family 39 protein [Deltaproteobacteria bacterium]
MRDLVILLVAGTLMLGAMWALKGLQLAPDSFRYLGAAKMINLQLPLVGQKRLTPGYTHPLAWMQRSGLELDKGLQVVVLLQCLLSLAAAALAYVALAPLWGRRAALLGGLLYLLLPNLQRWNIYILTDGPANSMLVVLMAATLMLPRRSWALALVLAAGAWLALLRSEGLVFLLPPMLYLAWRRRWLAAGTVAALLAALILGQNLGTAVVGQKMMMLIKNGEVMWEMSSLTPPPDLAGSAASSPVQFYMQALLTHPLWLIQVMGLRVFWLLFYAYPPHHPLWYSIAAPSLALALYLLAAWGTWRMKGQREQALFIWGFLAMAALVVAGTWVASDGRFLTRPLCCLVFLAGVGVERLLPGVEERVL